MTEESSSSSSTAELNGADPAIATNGDVGIAFPVEGTEATTQEAPAQAARMDLMNGSLRAMETMAMNNFHARKINGKIFIENEHSEWMLYLTYLTLRKRNGTFYRGRGAPRASDYFYYVDAENLNVTYTLNRRNFEDNRRDRLYDSTVDYLIDRENRGCRRWLGWVCRQAFWYTDSSDDDDE